MGQSFSQTLRLIKQDIASRCRYEKKPTTLLSTLKMLLTPGVMCIVIFRFQVFLYSHYLKPIAGLLGYINVMFHGISIDSRAKIEGGLIIVHANSIYISHGVVIGKNCILFHQNSICVSPFLESEQATLPSTDANAGPVIGDNVIVGAGASICGPITVGSGSKIAVNSTLESSCAENSVMFGVPARMVSKA